MVISFNLGAKEGRGPRFESHHHPSKKNFHVLGHGKELGPQVRGCVENI